MPNYRADQLVNLLRTMDARKNDVDDPTLLDENTLVELFFPISEKLTLSDTVEVVTTTVADMAWGGSTSVSATASADGDWSTRTNVVL